LDSASLLDNRRVDRDQPSRLLRSFERYLRAGNRSERTVGNYLESARQADTFLRRRGIRLEDATRADLEDFIADLLARRSAATAATRYKVLRVLYGWLEEEEEIPSPMAKMKPPIVPEQPVPVIPDDGLRRLLKVCEGKGFEARRDTALIMLLLDTGARRDELMNRKLTDLDLELDVLLVLGKGRRERTLPFGRKTALALDRYLRVRDRHKDAHLPWLWLGLRGQLTRWGLVMMLHRRGRQAGLPDLHPHQFRHAFAHQWLAEGGAEVDLMRLAGWRSRGPRVGRGGSLTRSARWWRRPGCSRGGVGGRWIPPSWPMPWRPRTRSPSWWRRSAGCGGWWGRPARSS
jgi:site-specific recombinase XerD